MAAVLEEEIRVLVRQEMQIAQAEMLLQMQEEYKQLHMRLLAVEAHITADGPLRNVSISTGSPMTRALIEDCGIELKEMSFRANNSQAMKMMAGVSLPKTKRNWIPTPTIWDASLLAGTPILSRTTSLSIMICLAACLAAQSMWCYLIVVGFLPVQKLPDEAVLRRWREIDAHAVSNADFVTGKSLARRVCENDKSLSKGNLQQGLIRDLQQFTAGGVGMLFCVGALSTWTLCVCHEVLDIGRCITAVWALPRGPTRWNSMADDPKFTYSLSQISFVRMCYIAAMSILRFIIALSLLLSGSEWMTNSTTLETLLIKSVTLRVVFLQAELLFKVLVPVKVSQVLMVLQPLPQARHHARTWVLAGFLCFIIGMHLLVVLPTNQQMHNLIIAGCGGEVDFIVGTQSQTGLVLHVPTKNAGAKQPDDNASLAQLAVRYLIQTGESNVSSNLYRIANLRELQSTMAMPLAELEQFFRYTRLGDNVKLADRPGLMAAIQEQTGIRTGRSCRDFQDGCQDPRLTLMRLACPVTCGCYDPRSGYLFAASRYGCSRSLRSLDSPEPHRPCRDEDVATLQGHPGWRRYTEQMRAYSNITGLRGGCMDGSKFSSTQLASELWAKGCGAVDDWFLKNYLCTGHVVASLRFYCPQACHCDDPGSRSRELGFSYPCPMKCASEIVKTSK